MATVIEKWSLRVKVPGIPIRAYVLALRPLAKSSVAPLEPPPDSPDLVLPISSRSRGCKQRLRLPNKMRQKNCQK